ncbi:hypothetical protein NQ317_014296 [Molorchus minor]|uniref:Fanconi anemia group I protein n=1 Tax=Molorchus minor TaxID=1323400 RepID=A0ABQ9JXD1_9CUCU|nr:hypothetical protein NQ317_014296 [Molorchus minor]
MTSIYNKIQEYAQKRDTHALQQLILGLNEDELINIIKTKVNSADFTYSWNYILQSFTDSADCHSKRFKMVLTLLNIEENDMPAIRRNTLINRLCIELMKFKSRHLADLCNYCLERIQSKKTQLTWKDLLPELLNVLAEREKFEYNDMEYTGLEYKTDFINSLCMSTWSPNIVTLLTSMFIDMPLTKEEHLKVVNKLGTYIEKMSPQEIPAFIYQLLKLCKQYNSRSVFLKLQLYFGSRIYNNANLNSNSSSDTNTNDLDVIENADNQDTIEAESTVLYHIHTAASLGHESIKDYLNSLKNITKSPEFVLNTFQLMILFTLSTIPHYEETVFDIVRPCIVRAYQEEQKKLHSAWFREMVPSTCKPEDILSQVIHFSLQDKESVIQGLVNFGFVLLAVGSSLGRDPIAEKQWNLGNIILLKIIKRKRHTALTIIQTLCNHIVTRQNVSQYIESLYVLCKTLPLLVLENQSCIVELMESLVQVPANVANQLLDAVIPLAKISPTIRDHLIILLRKALYSRVTETRQVAVNGFLKLLTNLKISSLAVLSQSSQCTGSFHSGHSLFTQLSINRSTQAIGSSNFSNEALCLEVLSILKRCFMQQKEVRSKLYEGLFDAVCVNLELGIPVLDLIWFHFSNYYIIDEEKLPPLDFGKITTIREEESILLEALGKFVYTIGLITSKVLESEEDRENQTVVRFVTILDSLCERMAKCELTHFELDENIDLSDNSLDSQQKTHVLKEAMCVYEALIGYKFCLWSKDSENHGQIINSLFQGYSRLSNIFKGFAKPKKLAAKKKKVDKNETRPASQANTTLKKDRQKAGKQLKPPDTVLTFDVLKKILTLLHEPTVDWTTPAQANLIKVKYDFHQHIMQVTLHLIENVKRFKCVETRYKKMFYDHLTDVAAVLFHRIINRLTEFIDFDCATAALAVDCFHAILKLMTGQYRGNFRQFLQKIVTNDDDFITHLTTVTKVYQKISEMGEERRPRFL